MYPVACTYPVLDKLLLKEICTHTPPPPPTPDLPVTYSHDASCLEILEKQGETTSLMTLLGSSKMSAQVDASWSNASPEPVCPVLQMP